MTTSTKDMLSRRAAVSLAAIGLLAASGRGWAQAPAEGPASQPAAATQPAGNDTSVARELKQLRDEIRAVRHNQRALEQKNAVLEQTLAAAETERVEAADAGKPETFSIYGFMDVNFIKWWLPDNMRGAGIVDDEPSFVFGNLNTYLDFRPLPSWRALAEIRFLLNPVGDTVSFEIEPLGDKYRRVDVTTTDAVSFGESFEYGTIEIERAQIEWSWLSWFQVTVGIFLTPYGIWNIDHGSPTRLTVGAPFLYAMHMFPERQLGIMLSGSHELSTLRGSYALTLSNGRGPHNNLRDSDQDKAFGGRLQLEAQGRSTFKIGFSWYVGQCTDYMRAVAFPELDVVKETTVQYDERALGADLTLHLGPVGLEAEGIAQWVNFDDAHRPSSLYAYRSFFPSDTVDWMAVGGKAADYMRWGAILTTSYRLPLRINLRPYLVVLWLDLNDNDPADDLLAFTFGVNWRIGGAVVIKLEHQFGHWPNKSDSPTFLSGSGNIHRTLSQLAVAF